MTSSQTQAMSAGSTDDPSQYKESMSPFIPTPERLSQYLELKGDEVAVQLKSVEGRQRLFDKLMEHEEELQKIHAFDPAELRRQLDVAGETIVAKEAYMKDVSSPEKKGMFRRMWEKVKSFPRKHPIVTALLILAAAAGGMYLIWQYMPVPVPNPMEGAAGAASELAPSTGGAFEAIPEGGIPSLNTGPPPYVSPGGAPPPPFVPPPPIPDVSDPSFFYPKGPA